MKHNYLAVFALSILFIYSCTNRVADVNKLFETHEMSVEIAKDIVMLYSDSALVKVSVEAPLLKRHLNTEEPTDEFPEGVYVEFYRSLNNPESWLESKYAIRYDREGIIVARDSVVLYNRLNEKIESSELIWDENEQIIYTDKFVRITQPEKGDTSYGYGLVANQNFTEFEIKRKFSAKMNVKDLTKALEVQ
jgi:LPS export ABC transporter protein LptC